MLEAAAEYKLDMSYYSEKFAQRFQFHVEHCGEGLKIIFDDRRMFGANVRWQLLFKEELPHHKSVEQLFNYLVENSICEN